MKHSVPQNMCCGKQIRSKHNLSDVCDLSLNMVIFDKMMFVVYLDHHVIVIIVSV